MNIKSKIKLGGADALERALRRYGITPKEGEKIFNNLATGGDEAGIKVVPSVDDLDPNAKEGTIAKVEGVEHKSVRFSGLPYVKLEDLNPDGTIKDADRFPRVTNLDLNTGIAADWYDFDYCFLIPRNINNTSPFSIIMLHPEYEYGAEEFWVCYYPNVRKGQDDVSQNDEGGTWIYDKTPGSTEATFRSFFIGWNVRDIIPEDLTFEQVLAAGDYVMAAPAVLGVTGPGLYDYMDADDYNIAGISAHLELNVIDKYYLAVIESTFSELYIKKDTWKQLNNDNYIYVDYANTPDDNKWLYKWASTVRVNIEGQEYIMPTLDAFFEFGDDGPMENSLLAFALNLDEKISSNVDNNTIQTLREAIEYSSDMFAEISKEEYYTI